jgi:hypothetical protein
MSESIVDRHPRIFQLQILARSMLARRTSSLVQSRSSLKRQRIRIPGGASGLAALAEDDQLVPLFRLFVDALQSSSDHEHATISSSCAAEHFSAAIGPKNIAN